MSYYMILCLIVIVIAQAVYILYLQFNLEEYMYKISFLVDQLKKVSSSLHHFRSDKKQNELTKDKNTK
jgi:hypothetical protein